MVANGDPTVFSHKLSASLRNKSHGHNTVAKYCPDELAQLLVTDVPGELGGITLVFQAAVSDPFRVFGVKCGVCDFRTCAPNHFTSASRSWQATCKAAQTVTPSMQSCTAKQPDRPEPQTNCHASDLGPLEAATCSRRSPGVSIKLHHASLTWNLCSNLPQPRLMEYKKVTTGKSARPDQPGTSVGRDSGTFKMLQRQTS